jgi:hypothetical protein
VTLGRACRRQLRSLRSDRDAVRRCALQLAPHGGESHSHSPLTHFSLSLTLSLASLTVSQAPLARVLLSLVMVGQMAYQIAQMTGSVSGMAHLGSFLLGLCGGVVVMMTHIPPTGWQKAAGAVAVLGLAAGLVALPLCVYGVGPLGEQAQFAASSFQCCYHAPEGWEPVCRTFPRAVHLRALPIKYDLPANTTW